MECSDGCLLLMLKLHIDTIVVETVTLEHLPCMHD